MKKSSNDMIKLTSIIENTDDVKASLENLCGVIVKPVTVSLERHINYI